MPQTLPETGFLRIQDLRKKDSDIRLLELLDQVVREQLVFNVIDGLSCGVGNTLESRPNE
jgi:hypothetical protein